MSVMQTQPTGEERAERSVRPAAVGACERAQARARGRRAVRAWAAPVLAAALAFAPASVGAQEATPADEASEQTQTRGEAAAAGGEAGAEDAARGAGALPPGHSPTGPGEAPSGDAPSGPPGHPPAGQTPSGEAGQMPPGHPPAGQAPTGQAPSGEAGQMPPGHPPTGQPSNEAGQMPPGHPPTGQAPTGQAPSGEAGQMPPGHPPTGQGQAPSGQGVPSGPLPEGHPTVPGGAGVTGRMRQAMRAPSLATAEASDEVPAGSIRVEVVDPEGEPVADAPVDVGSLAQGDRTRYNGRTDDDGVATFSDLPTGSSMAYRVNVPHEGATYSTTPFRLPPDRGYRVRVTRLPTTRDPRFVFFRTFRVIVEQRGERMHVVHQTELTNAGSETYVFPSEGEILELPEEATAFQFQRVMTDQRVEELADQGAAAMRGSLPPGTVRLAYAYDIPVGDEDLSIPVEVPFPFFALQVLAEAIPGLTMDVSNISGERRLDQQGQPCESAQADPTCAWVAVTRRNPEEAPLERFTIHLSGIPGPGPVRWIAVALAALFALGGAFVAFRKVDERRAAERARERRRARLLAEIRQLEEELEAGEIGPEFRQKRRDAIVRELAVLLHEEDAAREKEAAPAGRRPSRAAR
jgi:hypothetical protein